MGGNIFWGLLILFFLINSFLFSNEAIDLLSNELELIDLSNENLINNDFKNNDSDEITIEEAFVNGLIKLNSINEDNNRKDQIKTNFYQKELDIYLDQEIKNILSSPISLTVLNDYNKNNIPLIYNQYVENHLNYLINKKRSFIIESLGRAELYIIEMKKILKENNIPEDLAYLPLIESGFKNNALSRAKALGMWQFIPGTAKWIGLKRNEWFDERCDPLISCRFAAKYLKFLYDIFNDWYLVLASYNHGAFNIKKELKKINGSDYYDLVIKRATPKETRGYVPSFIASLIIIKNIQDYNIDYEEKEYNFDYYTLPFMAPIHLVAKYSNIDLKFFKELNPSLINGFVPDPKYEYSIRLPKENIEILEKNLDELRSQTKYNYISYYVKKGDVLSNIAQNFKISISLLMSINNIFNPNKLSVGQRLFIPIIK